MQHLKEYSPALDALQEAKRLEPTNKALIKEIARVEQERKVYEKEQAERAAAMEVEESAAADKKEEKKVVTTTTTTTTASKPTTTTTSKATTTKTEDKGLFTKSDAVRGYKIVNGKKTSYFHDELDDQTKALIGDIAPKKIEAPTTNETEGSGGGGASAWNKAGTWEEKNVTAWAKTSLEEQLLQTKYVLPDSSPAPGAKVKVTKVTTLDGHASVALARGKKRYIYEFLAKLEWSLTSLNDLECTGSLALPDIDGTIEMGEGYEIHDFMIDSVSDNEIRPLIDRFVHRGGFHDALNEQIDDWVRHFKKEY